MAKKNKEAMDKALEIALASMTKTFGKGFDRRGSALEKVDTFRTGHDDLDSVLVKDGFGIARGKIIELSGPEAAGKSSVALRICGYAQRDGYLPLWIDLERSLVKGGIAEINGVDMDKVIIPELIDTKATEVSEKNDDADILPYDAGKVLDIMVDAIRTGQFNPVVLDSVAALLPEREMKAASFNEEKMMESPRLLSRALKKINAVADEKNICVIFVNQERDKPISGGPSIVTTPGGRALKFFSSQRLRITKVGGKEGPIKRIDAEGRQELIGHWAKVRIMKNRCAPPYFDPIEIPIYYKEHFPDEAERLFEAARSLQVITARNNVVTWKADNAIVFRVEGTSMALHKIREEKLEPRLAFECKAAEKTEKNQKKKVPYRFPASLVAMADQYEKTQKK